MNKVKRSLFAGLSKSVSIAASTGCGYMIHSYEHGQSVAPIVVLISTAIAVIFFAEYKRESN